MDDLRPGSRGAWPPRSATARWAGAPSSTTKVSGIPVGTSCQLWVDRRGRAPRARRQLGHRRRRGHRLVPGLGRGAGQGRDRRSRSPSAAARRSIGPGLIRGIAVPGIAGSGQRCLSSRGRWPDSTRGGSRRGIRGGLRACASARAGSARRAGVPRRRRAVGWTPGPCRRVRCCSAPADLGAPLGAQVTLVQFSSEVCAYCGPTRELLTEVAAERDGMAFVEIDAAARMDLTRRLHVLSTPTVLVLDAARRHHQPGVRPAAQGRPAEAVGQAVRPGDGCVLNFPLNQATMRLRRAAPGGDSGAAPVNSIGYVPSRTAMLLTKRRAVDFCRVATAMCRPCAFRRLRTRACASTRTCRQGGLENSDSCTVHPLELPS